LVIAHDKIVAGLKKTPEGNSAINGYGLALVYAVDGKVVGILK
jgi:hypothetical protein